MKPGGTWGHTATGQIYIPEVLHKECPSDCHCVGLRGYRYVAAVVRTESRECVGWIRWTVADELEHELKQLPDAGQYG